MLSDEELEWLTEIEPYLYVTRTGKDPYSIWVTELSEGRVIDRPARLLSYAECGKAHVIFIDDNSRGLVFEQQMRER